MSDRLKEFYKKIHDKGNKIPLYISILIRDVKKILDIKIKKEPSNILKIIARSEKQKGWMLHSVHIPIKNLGFDDDAKNKELLEYLNEPRKITSDKETREYVEDLLRKYVEILPEKKKHHFKTQRFRKKKDLQAGTKLKGF